MSTLSLPDAAAILSITPDELMFKVQTNVIQAGIDKESMAWTFDLNSVLKLKEDREIEAAADNSED